MEKMGLRERATNEFQLNEGTRKIVREKLEEKGFKILEFTKTHVRMEAPDGKLEEMPNRAVMEYCGQ